MSLAAFLPPPRYVPLEPTSPPPSPPLLATKPSSLPLPASTSLTSSSTPFIPPPYGHRQGFHPRTPSDFGDGGAFPELNIPQYPLNMGRPSSSSSSSSSSPSSSTSLALLLHSSSSTPTPVQYDSHGVVKYDAIVQQGRTPGTRVQSSYTDMLPAAVTDADLARPTPEEEAKVVEETRKALTAVVEHKMRAAMPTHVAKQSKEATFIRYTPASSSTSHASGASQRLIRLTEAPVDPFQPLLVKHQKMPASVPEPPVPILHSPPRKLTAEDVAAWKIPPCISNWKNPRGYTIALDKRMATDGRGLQEVSLGDRHAKLAESLFVAERVAREEIEERAKVRSGVRKREKEEKEDELRRLAEDARRAVQLKEETADTAPLPTRSSSPPPPHPATSSSTTTAAERDAIRSQRQSELKRQLVQSTAKGKIATARDDERDISERIALGQAPPTRVQAFDSRLFGQSEGLGQGFGSDDAYAVYDRPLFGAGGGGGGMYKPRAVEDGDGGEGGVGGRPGFRGTEGGGGGGGGGRTKPVEFEREDADPFGLGSLLSEASADPAPPPPPLPAGQKVREREREEKEERVERGRGRDERRDDGRGERRREAGPERDGGRDGGREDEGRSREYERGRGGDDDRERDYKRRRH